MFALAKHRKKIIAAATIVAALIIIIVAGSIINANNSIDCNVSKTENGSVQISASLDDLKTKNIEIGDSLNVVFDTGYNVEDVPLLNGPYMCSARHIITVSGENSAPVFQIQDADGTWDKASLNESSTVHISMSKKAKYKTLNDALNRPITGDIKDVRSLRGGNLKLLDIFRGANPRATAETSSQLPYYFRTLNITNMINLSENSFGVSCFDIKNKNCDWMVVDTLKKISANNEKTYIYSNNNDLTAYFCAICMALAGASYEEIINDYMETYKNLYGITKENNPAEYEAIKKNRIDVFLHKFTKTPPDYDMNNCNFAYDGEMYLRTNQLNTDEIQNIKNRLTKI